MNSSINITGSLVILPHQLYNDDKLDKGIDIVLWEHPHYFKEYKYNKKKLILHRASMKYYEDYLKKKGYKVKYINYSSKFTLKNYTIFDPIDNIELPGTYTMLESPNFLLTKEHYSLYRKKTDKFMFNAFYMWGKKIVDIIPNIKSQDKDNRKKLPRNGSINIPKLPAGSNSNRDENKFIKSAIIYVNKHFPNNYGNVDNFIFPISHNTAKKWFLDFINNKFKLFGDYQDSINTDEEYLFHSVLSSSINIGLLNPKEIIEILKSKRLITKIPLNSFEGYIRQLFWREYQRYCYIYYDFKNKKYFNNNSKLTKEWYEGTLGIEPVDNAIKIGFETGYLHHISRLMIMGNFMNLSNISPSEGFKWFMEFSCDSYEWVMCQNVYDMVFFVSGGATMRRPYISSSNYILKMSDYKKGQWSEKWDNMYQMFIEKNKEELHKFRYYYRVKK